MNTKEYLKYLLNAKEWTPDEKKWMLGYLDANDLSELEAVAAAEFNADLHQVKSILDRRLSENLLDKIHQQLQPAPVSGTPVVRWYRSRMAVAAAVVLLIGGAAFFFRDNLARLLYPVEMLQVAAGALERKRVDLPDGSIVSLEPGSSLEYPARFRDNKREINLQGEAFFEVTRQSGRPFVIHTPLIQTTVLGTSFTVQAHGEQEAKVVVITGRVKVEAPGASDQPGAIEVTVNQSAVYNKNTGKLEKREAANDARFYEHRHAGKFVYEGVPMESVIRDMERFYNAPIQLNGKVKDCSFYGSFYTSDDLEKALRLVSVTLNAKFKKDSVTNRYMITGGACH